VVEDVGLVNVLRSVKDSLCRLYPMQCRASRDSEKLHALMSHLVCTVLVWLDSTIIVFTIELPCLYFLKCNCSHGLCLIITSTLSLCTALLYQVSRTYTSMFPWEVLTSLSIFVVS